VLRLFIPAIEVPGQEDIWGCGDRAPCFLKLGTR